MRRAESGKLRHYTVLSPDGMKLKMFDMQSWIESQNLFSLPQSCVGLTEQIQKPLHHRRLYEVNSCTTGTVNDSSEL